MAVEQSREVAHIDAHEEPRGPSDFQLAIRELKKRPPAIIGLFCLVIVILFAIIPGTFSPLDPVDQDLARYIKPPGFTDAEGRVYLLGTDQDPHRSERRLDSDHAPGSERRE